MGISEKELEELQNRPGVKAVKDSREGGQQFRLPQVGQGGSDTKRHNSNTIRITLDVEPKGQMRPRFFSRGKVQKTYKAAQQKAEESRLLGLLYQHAPAQPLSGPVSISIAAFLPVPRSWPKWKRTAATEGKVMPAKKPDWDNVAKQICDVFNGIFWRDDQQIVEASVRKEYSLEPRWEIEIKPLESDT